MRAFLADIGVKRVDKVNEVDLEIRRSVYDWCQVTNMNLVGFSQQQVVDEWKVTYRPHSMGALESLVN